MFIFRQNRCDISLINGCIYNKKAKTHTKTSTQSWCEFFHILNSKSRIAATTIMRRRRTSLAKRLHIAQQYFINSAGINFIVFGAAKHYFLSERIFALNTKIEIANITAAQALKYITLCKTPSVEPASTVLEALTAW